MGGCDSSRQVTAILIGGIHQLGVILEEGVELAVGERVGIGAVILQLVSGEPRQTEGNFE